MVRIWVDDVRPAPSGYIHCLSVNHAIQVLEENILAGNEIAVLDLDHDAGNYQKDGGDYIRILDWLESEEISVPVRIHSQNPVGRENMRRIIRHNGWKEIF